MHETVYLSDPRSPLRIEYSQAAMEQIRKRAREGLMAAPRIGVGVGGLLLGVRENSRIRLLDSIDIPCSHSAGPSFNLTPDEIRESGEMVTEAGALSVSGKVGVIGWYCSKTRGDAVLNESDLSFYAELFPGTGQVALVLRPSVLDPMRAAFFLRDESGVVVKAVECEVDEWSPAQNAVSAAPVAEPDAEPDKDPNAPATLHHKASGSPAPGGASQAAPPRHVPQKVVEIPQPAAKAANAPNAAEKSPPLEIASSSETKLSDIIGLSSPDGALDADRPAASPLIRSQLFGVPIPLTPAPRRRSKLPLILAAAALVLLGGTAAYFTQDSWLPKPPLTLATSELNGALLIHWNAEALRGIDHAQMFVNDGGQPNPLVIPLDRLQLNSGLLSYPPKSKHVTAKLDAGEITAIITWIAPAPTDAPATDLSPPATPPPTATQSAQDSGKTGR